MVNEVRTSVHNVLANKTIDYTHHECHVGKMNYLDANFTTVTNNNSSNVLVSVSSTKEAHMAFSVVTNGPAWIHFYENVFPASTSYGNVISPINMNRNFTTSAGTLFYGGASVANGTAGTLLFTQLIVGDTGGGSGSNIRIPVGGEARNGIEWILKPSTNYLIAVINTSGVARDTHIETEFYEE